MADIHQIITLGIGTPSDIEHLTLFGLSATGSVATTPEVRTWSLRDRDILWSLDERDTALSLRDRDTTWTVEAR